MSQWTDRILSHPIWQHMTALGPTIDRAVREKILILAALTGFERVRAVLTFTGKRLAGRPSIDATRAS